MTIEIINSKDFKPSQPFDTYIDRRSPIGNPFILKDERFIAHLNILMDVYRKYGRLRLFCWCAPKRCHGETIISYFTEPL